MRRPWPIALLLTTVLASPADLPAQTRAAPLYALPADGTWVEYDWESPRPGGAGQTGTLRISSVGTTTVQGVPHRWVEITKEVRHGGRVHRRAQAAGRRPGARGRPLDEAVARGYDQAGGGREVPLSNDRLRAFTALGIQGPQEALREVATGEEVRTSLGTFRTRHVTAIGSTAGRILEYHGWLSPDLPFGWARMEIRQPHGDGPPQTVFRASASRTGRSSPIAGGGPARDQTLDGPRRRGLAVRLP
jgi:hypothetical protein